MKNTLWKKTAAIFALSFGALIAPPAYAACDLCSLARTGNLAEVQNHLDNRAEIPVDINSADNSGRTALFWAAKNNHTEIAELLLNDPDDPADANIANNGGKTPLMLAAQNGNMALVEILVGRVTDINLSGGNKNQNALELALENGHNEVAEYLVVNGANLDGVIVPCEGDGCVPAEALGGETVSQKSNRQRCRELPNTQYRNGSCDCRPGYEGVRDFAGCLPECASNEVRDGLDCVPCGENQKPSIGQTHCECINDYVVRDELGTDRCVVGYYYCQKRGQILVEGPDDSYCESCGENEMRAAQGNYCQCIENHLRNSDGECVDYDEYFCGDKENEEWISGSNCDCIEGHVRNPQTGICNIELPSPEVCNAKGETFVNGECEPCADGTQLHENENRCIHTMESCNEQGLVLYEDSNGVSSCVTEEESCRFNDKVLRDGECEMCGDEYRRHFNECWPIVAGPCNAKNTIFIPDPPRLAWVCDSCPEGMNADPATNTCVPASAN